jgi:hypothetical protein
MRDSIEQLRLSLLELGCPLPRLQRMVREVAEHREDLLCALIAEGVTPAEAEARAEERLGDPRMLAENLMKSQQQSSWCGRHRVVAFGVLPIVGFPLFWVAVLCLNLSLAYAFGFGWDERRLHAAAGNPAIFPRLASVAYAADYFSIALVTVVFCALAGRAAVRRGWIFFGCLIWAAYSSFLYTYVSPHNYTIGLSTHPQWLRASIPLLIIGLAQAYRARQVRLAANPFAKAV